MNLLTMRFAEMPITEWRGVRVRVIVEHPDAPNSFTYQHIYDSHLMPLRKLRQPADNATERELREYFHVLDDRKRAGEMLAAQVGAAVSHALSTVDKLPK